MKTPIFDFLSSYADSDISRFHMPGHKGLGRLGVERYDITEISGADTLYFSDGIISRSEENATELFGTAHTYYSAEGSTLAIKAMLATALVNCGGKSRTLVAARNAHKALIYAAAELDFDISWLFPETDTHYCSCKITEQTLRRELEQSLPFAVYITSPDYLGSISDVSGLAAVCHEYGVPLLVDNAHGAYLAFTNPVMHPIALGADMCADSAHKTLPVLTGGAYLHISKSANAEYEGTARKMLSAFASTSPSYLLLASLDLCNGELSSGSAQRIRECADKTADIKKKLSKIGVNIMETEPLKIVIHSSLLGYSGTELAEHLRRFRIEAEFADSEYTVLMVTPNNTEEDFSRLLAAASALEKREALKSAANFVTVRPRVHCSIKNAVFSKSEQVCVSEAVGRACAAPIAACPPAVPIVVSGEVIDEKIIEILLNYKIEKIEVMKL